MISRSALRRARALGNRSWENHKKFFSAISANTVVDAELRTQPPTDFPQSSSPKRWPRCR